MQTDNDGVNSFNNRLPFIIDTLRSIAPDIIGGQEVLPEMYHSLIERLPDYFAVGQGRGENNLDEACPIFFKKDKFVVSSCDTFWLSHTPKISGSRYDVEGQSSCPRVCTVAKLIQKNGSPLFVYNTHLDHIGSIPRLYGIRQIHKLIETNYSNDKIPFVLMGDMNAEPNSPEIREITYSKTPKIKDLTTHIPFSCHGYGKYQQKIDYIFVEDKTELLYSRAITDKNGEMYLSDHYPILAEVEFFDK